MSISDLRHGRRVLMRKLNELAEKQRLSDVEQVEFERHKNSIQSQDARIERADDARDLEIDAALDALQSGHVIHPAARDDPYRDDAAAARRGMGSAKGMILGGLAKAMAHSYQHQIAPAESATRVYGERHRVTETMQMALLAGVGQSGGFVIPPDQSLELIELLPPKVALRAAGPRMLPMPRGTLTLPAQTAAAAASYGSDVATIADSSPLRPSGTCPRSIHEHGRMNWRKASSDNRRSKAEAAIGRCKRVIGEALRSHEDARGCVRSKSRSRRLTA